MKQNRTNAKKKVKNGYKKRQQARIRDRIKNQLKKYLGGLLACLAIVAVILVITLVVPEDAEKDPVPQNTEPRVTETVGNNTFTEGITVNGISLNGQTLNEVKESLNKRNDDLLGNTVTVTYGEDSWILCPADIGVRWNIDKQVQTAWDHQMEHQGETVDFEAELDYDEAALSAFVQEIKQVIDRDPVDASMEIVEIEQFRFTDSQTGYSLDAEKAADQIIQAIKSEKSERIELVPDEIAPAVSREELELSTVLLGECFTSLDGSSSSRTSNVNLALSYFNFMVIEPDQKVSFNKVVGKRTEKNGFKEAPEYDGTLVVDGIGGGTCQASTTVYGAVIRAGLEILERHQHTMSVAYVPASQDAAVNEDDKDMRFKNTTGSRLYVFAYVDSQKEQAVCKIYGRQVDPLISISIESVVTQTDISGTGVSYKDDTEGKYVWYIDEAPVLYKAGKPGITSEAYRTYTNILTGEEIKRERLSKDTYRPGDNVYWRGVHQR